MSDCTKVKADQIEHGKRWDDHDLLYRTISWGKPTKLVKAWHLTPQLALHSTMKWLTTLAPRITHALLYLKMTCKLDCLVVSVIREIFFHSLMPQWLLSSTSVYAYSPIPLIGDCVWFPIHHLGKMHLLGHCSSSRAAIFALLLSSIARAIDLDISDERTLWTLHSPFYVNYEDEWETNDWLHNRVD